MQGSGNVDKKMTQYAIVFFGACLLHMISEYE